ncbi:galactose mutarotase-like protein [Mollisia scopiformis]|uniref:Galactose mutarotase-like protein n=1 Tax=Mollisia scopiformis TaxID=149040 RepID=A0A132B3G8_MOLSC|nr:galactose mutarotase-like protein [Mollisia scopiformis]KUJ06881.1 galactose mutarotase-like protein [Mollisia scopiformis]
MKLSAATTLFSLALATVPPPGPDGKYTLTAPGITAKFIPYAACITNLLVPDKNGTLRDIILGYDNASFYPVDPNHSDYGAVPGRYANRIKDHTYVLNGTRYFTEANDGNGTLHSGTNGWSHRVWNVSAVSNTSITFSITDVGNSSLGMPGTVMGSVTHSVSNSSWHTTIAAHAVDHVTPLMLTTHPYWNLDAFANPDTDLILNHTLSLPFGKRMIGIDENTESTGELPTVPKGDINDFWSAPKMIGASMGDARWVGNCGTAGGCAGYNNQWLVDRGSGEEEMPIATLSSGWSGIKWDLYSDQPGIVVYSCHWMGGGNQLKAAQGGKASNGFVRKDGCVAVEPQDWIDGINHPEWNRTQYQINGPGMPPFSSFIQYKFSTV